MTVLKREDFESFLEPQDGICWWCRERPADSREHKFKASDLVELWSGHSLRWVAEDGNMTHDLMGLGAIKRDRYGILRFQRSLCQRCNNTASQPYDLAYQAYSSYVATTYRPYMTSIPLFRVFPEDWETSSRNVARYFIKHFGCRLADNGVKIPDSMRDFLNGAPDMSDVRLNLVTVKDFTKGPQGSGLAESAGYVFMPPDKTRIAGIVEASFVRTIGVRFEWRSDGFSDAWQDFFKYPTAVVNRYDSEEDLMLNHPHRNRISRFLNQRRN